MEQDITPEPVAEELRLLSVVLKAAHGPRSRFYKDYEQELIALRDELVEERLPEDRASLIEQMDRVARLAAHQASSKQDTLDTSNPYFGHMRLVNDDGERRDILIGKNTFVKDGVRVVDWRNAPISRVFYQGREGDEYSVIIAKRRVEGEIQVRRTLAIRNGTLIRVNTSDGNFVLSNDEWIALNEPKAMLTGGAGTAARPDSIKPVLGVGDKAMGFGRRDRVDKHLPEIVSLLDPEQFDLITQPDSGLVAIQGSAGSGKTTVALHRVAYLAFHDMNRFHPSRSLIVVYSPALARYISQVLPALGLKGVQVRTFENWAGKLRRELFHKLPERYSSETPAIVTRFKLHTALIPMIAEGVKDNSRLCTPDIFDEILTNKSWLKAQLAKHAPGDFSTAQINEIHRWCTNQHFIRAEGGGHHEHDVPCMDVEDDAILLYIYQQKHGCLKNRQGRQIQYSHLVVDEAQDLSPIELKVLLDTVPKGAPITLAGDTAQKVMDDNDFRDWDQVLAVLGREHVQVSPLKVSYRSTVAVAQLAHEVLGHLAPDDPVQSPREGVSPELFQFEDRGEAIAFLADSLAELADAEPTASVGVLTRYAAQAKEVYAALERAELLELELVEDYDFSFSPGVEVAEVRHAKGLEYDYVVMWDCDSITYPVDDSARHHMHVGITRAAYQCWLVAIGSPSPLLPNWLQGNDS